MTINLIKFLIFFVKKFTYLFTKTKSYLMPLSLNKKFLNSNTGNGHGRAGTVTPEYVYVIPGSPYATC